MDAFEHKRRGLKIGKKLCWAGITVVALGVVFLRVFTAEYFCRDEPTVLLVVEWPKMAGCDDRQCESPRKRGAWIWVEDENDYPGSGIYRFLTGRGR